MIEHLLFIETLIFLLLFSAADLYFGEVESWWIYLAYLSIIIVLYSTDSIISINVYAAILSFIFGYIMYYFKAWGGADVRIMGLIGLTLGWNLALVKYFAILMLLTLPYYLVARKYYKKEIPFVPAMTITFILTMIR